MSGLKLNAEYFLEVMEASAKNPTKKPFFEFKYNPFRFDVLGKMMTFDQSFNIPKSVMLSPDMSTLREMAWLKNEAMVMADVHHPDTEEILPYSPRNILKETAKEFNGIDTQVLFTFLLQKFGKEEKE